MMRPYELVEWTKNYIQSTQNYQVYVLPVLCFTTSWHNFFWGYRVYRVLVRYLSLTLICGGLMVRDGVCAWPSSVVSWDTLYLAVTPTLLCSGSLTLVACTARFIHNQLPLWLIVGQVIADFQAAWRGRPKHIYWVWRISNLYSRCAITYISEGLKLWYDQKLIPNKYQQPLNLYYQALVYAFTVLTLAVGPYILFYSFTYYLTYVLAIRYFDTIIIILPFVPICIIFCVEILKL
jgi:hypothetical protein